MVNLDDYVKDVFAFVFENLCLCVVLSMFFSNLYFYFLGN